MPLCCNLMGICLIPLTCHSCVTHTPATWTFRWINNTTVIFLSLLFSLSLTLLFFLSFWNCLSSVLSLILQTMEQLPGSEFLWKFHFMARVPDPTDTAQLWHQLATWQISDESGNSLHSHSSWSTAPPETPCPSSIWLIPAARKIEERSCCFHHGQEKLETEQKHLTRELLTYCVWAVPLEPSFSGISKQRIKGQQVPDSGPLGQGKYFKFWDSVALTIILELKAVKSACTINILGGWGRGIRWLSLL